MAVCGCTARTVPVLLLGLLVTMTTLGGAAMAIPAIAPPDTTVDIGAAGVTAGDAYAEAEDVLLVAPGGRITLRAAYAFEDNTLDAGATYSYIVILRASDGQTQIGVASAQVTALGPASVSESGSVEFEFAVPEVVRGISATLEAWYSRSTSTGSALLDTAFTTVALTLLAIPEPVGFLSDDLVLSDTFHVGAVDFTGSTRDVSGTDGQTLVSTDTGTRFTAQVDVERPAGPAVNNRVFHASVSLSVVVEGGGPGYSSSRDVFADFCQDWAQPTCGASAETRSLELEVVLPAGAIPPGSIVRTSITAFYESSWFDQDTGMGDWDGHFANAQGRHLVTSV